MNCPFSLNWLLSRTQQINGFEKIKCSTYDLTKAGLEVCQDYSDWPEGHGFGSSDGTFAIKEVLDILCLDQELTTSFTPRLSIIEKIAA